MDNNFDINAYFTKDYGLSRKPTVSAKRYKFNKKLIIAIIAAIVLIVIGHIATILIGIAAIAAVVAFGIVLPIMKENARIAKEQAAADEWQKNYDYRAGNWDAEFDKFFDKTCADMDLMNRGMQKLGIDDSQLRDDPNGDVGGEQPYIAKPFAIHGHNNDSYYRFCKDGVNRADSREITWIYFSKEQVYIYCIKFKLTDLTKKNESTREFFYTDIVSISVGTKSVGVSAGSAFSDDGQKRDTVEAETFTLIVPGDKLNFAFTSNDSVNKSVQAMKALIRQKKVG